MRKSLVFGSALVWSAMVTAHAFAFEAFNEVTGNPLGAASEWTNYLRLDDLDGDGDLDVIVPNCGGFFSSPVAQPFRVYKNDGKATFTESPELLGGAFSAAIRVVDVGDIDGDGDLDIFAPSASGAPDRLFVNGGKGAFIDEAKIRIGSMSHSAGVRFVDVEADGDLDLLVAGGYAASEPVLARLYLNDGKGVFTEALGKLPSQGPQDIDDVDVFDADRDFDLDVLLNSHGGKPALWLNDGNGAFTDATVGLGTNGDGLKYGPTSCDVDGDGDLDLWIDNTGPDYTEALLINDGKGVFVDETSARVTGNPSSDDNGVVCADVDVDGDFDAIVVALSGTERVLLNDGKGHFTHVGGFPPIGDSTLWLDAGDLNGDGRLDAVTGQGESGDLKNRVYLGTGDNAVDTRAPEVVMGPLPAMFVDGQSVTVRMRVTDRVLGDSGSRVRAELRVTVDGVAAPSTAARFVGGDLYQASVIAPPGVAVLLEACATDMQGNSGCSAKTMVTGPGSATAGTSTGAGGGASASATSGTAQGVGGGDPSVGGSAEDGGCSCSVDGRARGSRGWLGGWVAFALVGLRRRRQVSLRRGA